MNRTNRHLRGIKCSCTVGWWKWWKCFSGVPKLQLLPSHRVVTQCGKLLLLSVVAWLYISKHVLSGTLFKLALQLHIRGANAMLCSLHYRTYQSSILLQRDCFVHLSTPVHDYCSLKTVSCISPCCKPAPEVAASAQLTEYECITRNPCVHGQCLQQQVLFS